MVVDLLVDGVVLIFSGYWSNLCCVVKFINSGYSIYSGGLPNRLVMFIWFNIGSRGTLTIAQSNNYKAPPILTDGVDYEKWKKEIKIWRMLSSLEKKNQAPSIFFNSDRTIPWGNIRAWPQYFTSG